VNAGWVLPAFALGVTMFACSTGSTAGFTPDAGGESFSDASFGPESATQTGKLTGRVFAPEGSLPISGALIYVTGNAPGPISDGAHCDKCVVPGSKAYAISAADGTFTVPLFGKGPRYLVVQKGPFRRVRALTFI
jgi:hypothetical protein